MENASEIRKHLFGLSARGIKYDLARMRIAAEAIGNPQNTYRSFHVAGTNGKGSTCAYLESALRHCGVRTGLYTSPHLVRFEERFAVDGRPVREKTWVEAYRRIEPVIEDLRLTFFEAATLMSFEIFKRERVEWVVFEAGLGGRLDATNVVVPRVSVITRLAMDHMDYLGNDVLLIAAEKLGIVKKNIPLVMAEPSSAEVRELAVRRCAELDASCTFAGADGACAASCDACGATFTWEGRLYRINLRGQFQIVNALVALHALSAAGFGDAAGIAKGLERAWLPGRFQAESIRGKIVLFDVGHNPDAAEAFCSALKRGIGGQSVCCVLGIMKDKDIAGILRQYAGIARSIIFTAPKTERAAHPGDLTGCMPAGRTVECRTSPDVVSAVETALKGPDEIVCVAGSFFTVGEAMVHLKIDPYPNPASCFTR